ncbi:MAG TPA: helix-turn-helix domain-containing protein, partial [Ktedonobacteraceae bacterium]
MEQTFGASLRALRLQAGLSQRELAKRASLDISYISKLETGSVPPPATKTVFLLSSILGVPAEDLLATTHKLPTDVEEQISRSVAAQQFLREAQDLSDDQWRRLTRSLHHQKGPIKTMFPTRATASDLTLWANRVDAPGLLPELIRRLILATMSLSDISLLYMPSGEGIQNTGYDGKLEVAGVHPYVPMHQSVWEMGVDQDPKRKAEDDYAKRTENPLGVDPSQTTFVFVTPRHWARKEAWATEKRKTGPWHDIRVLDAGELEAWLSQAPAVHAWISCLLGKDPGGIQDLASFWLDWREATQPPLSTELIIAGREPVAEQILEQLQASSRVLPIRADAQEEALAFLAAVFERLPEAQRDTFFARSLIVHSPIAWQQLAYTGQPLVLLPTFSPVVTVQATRQGHHVLLPLGLETAETDGMVVLPRPSRQAAEAALKAMGFGLERASTLAAIAHRSLLSLRRQLALNPAVQQPAWADADHARPLLSALLAGSWDEAVEGDQNVLAALAGRAYAEISADLMSFAFTSDPPVRQAATVWLLASKEDAWQLLWRLLTRQDLERFRQAFSEVFTTLDPSLELPVEERWQANIMGHARPHSRFLREGLVDTLALMATRAGNSLLGG